MDLIKVINRQCALVGVIPQNSYPHATRIELDRGFQI